MKRQIVILAACATLAGCAKGYVAVSYRSTVQSNTPGEVFATPKYTQAKGKIRTVAVRAPDDCVNQTAAVQSGMSRDSRLVMQTRCGVWLGELEKALVGAGYRVISWNELHTMETRERLPTFRAAKQLTADAVFMINSMEFNAITPDQLGEEFLEYTLSNPAGDALGRAELDQVDRRGIREVVRRRFKEDAVTGQAATVDISAVLSDSGEAIWFYRNSVTDVGNADARTRMLLRGRSGHWRPVLPAGLETAAIPADEFASSESMRSRAGGAADRSVEHQRNLARMVLQDFVTKFTTGA